MASILRQIVAGPRARHPEAGLDLCYVTDSIIATSGPSSTYPQRAYRNPTDALVKFLDYKHGENWSIWEFRAEGTGYPDSEVYNRIRHFPWPDHHPPPFALVPRIMATMRDWLTGPEATSGRVAVVHCKAGKGRSGTVACSYLISQEGWTVEDALARFTERRMRTGFGAGVSIPSQQRWIKYVDYWTNHGKAYIDRPIEVLEVHILGLRDGVRISVDGYIDEGRKIKTFHTFSTEEKTVLPDMTPALESSSTHSTLAEVQSLEGAAEPAPPSVSQSTSSTPRSVVFRPAEPIVLPNSDINIDIERRNKAKYGFTMVTSVAHVWFNTFFESLLSSTKFSNSDPISISVDQTTGAISPTPPSSGVFTIDWEAMDGIRGSAKKGSKAFDRLSVVWRVADDNDEVFHTPTEESKDTPMTPIPATTDASDSPSLVKIITHPSPGESVPDSGAADWRKASLSPSPSLGGRKDLGLRAENPGSATVSKASSVISAGGDTSADEGGSITTASPPNQGLGSSAAARKLTTKNATSNRNKEASGPEEGVKAHGPQGEEYVSHRPPTTADGDATGKRKEGDDTDPIESQPQGQQQQPPERGPQKLQNSTAVDHALADNSIGPLQVGAEGEIVRGLGAKEVEGVVEGLGGTKL